MIYDLGESTTLFLSNVRDEAQKLVDPDKVLLTIEKPDGSETTREWPPDGDIEKETVGNFKSIVDLDAPGAWGYRWVTEGVVVVEQGTLFVGLDTFADPFPDEDLTVAEIWARSPFLQTTYKKGAGDGDLVLLVATAAPLVASLTGRAIAGVDGEAIPPELRELALRVIAMKAEQYGNSMGTYNARRKTIGSGNLRGFRAGSYSEDYFGPDEMMKAKRLDPDPILAELLWALATEEKREEWLELWDPSGARRPASAVRAFDWNQRPGGY